MKASHPGILARSLEPLVSALWIFFLLLSLVAGVVWAFGIGDAHPAGWVHNEGLAQALQWLLRYLDLAWITLGAINAYLLLISREGMGTARRWGAIIILGVVAVAWISARSGFPLGRIEYSSVLAVRIELGRTVLETRLGPVPIGLPLFWFAVIAGAREGLLYCFPRWSHLQVSLGVGLLSLLTDVLLESAAAKLRGWWFWRPDAPGLPPLFDAPISSCFAWGILAGVIAVALRDRSVVMSARPRSGQLALIFVVIHGILLLAQLGRWLRR